MDCPACLSKVKSGDSRCSSCGASLISLATTIGAAPPPSPASAYLDFPPGAVFANRYTIIERAGRGGMGVVYKAIDTALDSVLALKLIRPEFARRASFVSGFKREVRLTRQVTHPNVCRVHDLGEVGGILYLSMEWIQGETLRQLLNHAGPLDPERAMEIAERTLLALEAAHAKGIIHRDLKPENIMIDDAGSVFVMDFGLAVQQSPDQEETPGIAVGTPAYMAPEQRRGDPADARTDLYALGLVLAEMLSGRMPDPANPAFQTLPPALKREAGPFLDRLLAESVEARYPSTREAIEALRRIRPQVSGVRGTPLPPRARMGRAGRILIWSGAGAGVIAAALVLFHALRAPAGTAPGAAGDPAGATSQEARAQEALRSSPGWGYFQQGVEYLVKESDDLRGVDAALQMLNRAVEADPDLAPAWATLGTAYWVHHEQAFDAVSEEKAEESRRRAVAIDPSLPDEICAEGVGHYVGGDYPAAKADLERAVRSRPAFDFAWARLAAALSRLDDYPAALAAAGNAVRLRPDSALYRIMLGNVHDRFAMYDAAAAAYRTATELKPNSRMAWNNLGATFLRNNRPKDAAAAFTRALEIAETPSTRSNLATAYFHLKDDAAAIVNYRRAAELSPRDPVMWGNLGDALQRVGKKAEAHATDQRAVREARAAVKSGPPTAAEHGNLGLYCARGGDALCAIEEATRADQLQPRDTDILFTNAIIRAILGRQDEALDWLERAVNLGLAKSEIANEPALDPLRRNPRYRKILRLED
jgi:serine/threonine protein kinase/predicted TPR repeat methyltransferase